MAIEVKTLLIVNLMIMLTLKKGKVEKKKFKCFLSPNQPDKRNVPVKQLLPYKNYVYFVTLKRNYTKTTHRCTKGPI